MASISIQGQLVTSVLPETRCNSWTSQRELESCGHCMSSEEMHNVQINENGSPCVSRNLELELTRLDIFPNSMKEAENNLQVKQESATVAACLYDLNDAGNRFSEIQMKRGMEKARATRTAIPQFVRVAPSQHHLHHHHLQHQQPPYHHQYQQQQHRSEQGMPHGTVRTAGVGTDGGGDARNRTYSKQERTTVTPYAMAMCPAPLTYGPSQHPTPGAEGSEDHAPQRFCRTDDYQSQHLLPHLSRQHQSQLQQHQHNGVCHTLTDGVHIYGDGASARNDSKYCQQQGSAPSMAAVSPSSSVIEQDYPIRGTISPLTAHVGGAVRQRDGGRGDHDEDEDEEMEELSFVFGRPATSEAAFYDRCVSPPLTCDSDKPPFSREPLPIRRSASANASTSVVVEREVMSPPPSASMWTLGEGRMLQGGVCCEQCNACLIQFKRQALRLMFPDNGSGACLAQSVSLDGMEERLTVPETMMQRLTVGRCQVCETAVTQLKQEAVSMIRSIQLAQCLNNPNIPALVGSCNINPQQYRYVRQGKTTYTGQHAMPIAVQAQAYLEHNVRAWINPKKYNHMVAARVASQTERLHAADNMADAGARVHPHPSGSSHTHLNLNGRPPLPGGGCHSSGGLNSNILASPPPSSSSVAASSHHMTTRGASPSSASSPVSPPSSLAAVSFFHRAAQKLNKKKKRQQSQEPEPPCYPTAYGHVVGLTPPPAPPCLLRTVGRLHNPGVGKVKVMIRVCASGLGGQAETGASFLSVDPRHKQLTIFDPSASGYVTAANRRAGVAAPKMFAFDAVFSPDDSLTELCAASLSDIVQAVVSGADGCLFTYGYSKTGKTYTMLGTDRSGQTLGAMPCAIAWLFKLINEQKDKTGARFSVRVSAVEVTGKNETLRDLLVDIAHGTEATGVGTAPSVYLREDPICGTQLENQSELRAPSADKAALYLDAALAARSATDEDDARSSHLLFTLNVYQYRIEKTNRAGLPGVAGGRSRLHLIDLGSPSKSKDPGHVALSLSALGNVIMALLNGQRHVPHRDSKISQLLRDSLGNVTCRTCMLAHVSSAVPHYNETLQVVQLAARIHRMKRRRAKFSSTSSEDSSTDESTKFRRPYRGLRMGTLREDILYSSSHSDPDYTSSSEQSCDTVIYMGANGQSLSDRELTDHEGPPRHVPRTNPRLPRRPSGSRSSGDDSDSGRSRASDGRIGQPPHPMHPGMDPRLLARAATPVQGGSPIAAIRSQAQAQAMSAPGSPNPGHVKLAHRLNLHGKGASAKVTGSNDVREGSTHWPDKASKQHGHRIKTAADMPPIQGEQWVDGPGAAIYPESKLATEQWVDGPPAFVVQNEPVQPPPQPLPPQPQSPQHRGDTLRRLKNRKVDAEEQWVDGPREMMASATDGGAGATSAPMHTSSTPSSSKPCSSGAANKLSMGVSERALKQALIRHLEKERPESSMSVDSSISVTAQAADSRPTSMGSNSDSTKPTELCGLSPGHKQDAATCTGGKNSVKGWQDRHRSAGDGGCSGSVNERLDVLVASGDAESHVTNTLESSSCTSHRKYHKDHISKKSFASVTSPKHSPKSSPSSSRKTKEECTRAARLQKAELPGSASPTHRVVQWIKSVSSSECASVEDCKDFAVENAISDNIKMADAETNTEHDSDFERMAASEGSNKCTEEIGRDRSNAADSSFDSSQDKDSDALQDSIYEFTVEEQLEKMTSRVDGSRLAAEVDDETFSSLSCSAREADDTDREESALVEVSKVLTEGQQNAKLARHLAGHDACSMPLIFSDSHPAYFADASRPTLSRKPDGASNPHLNREFFHEEALSKDQFVHTNTVIEAHYATIGESDSPSQSVCAKLDSEWLGLSDNLDTSSLNMTDKCSRFAVRSKPPLPQKPSSSSTSSSPKTSMGPKPSSLSSSCSSSGPLPISSASSTPKSISSKDSPIMYKQNSPKGSTLSVTSTSLCSRKEKEKNTKAKDKASSSGALFPPTSGKGGSQKCSKSQVSKLPLFSGRNSSQSPSIKESKLRKKEKESTKGVRTMNGKFVEISHHHQKGRGANNDSDSGNDSGIVAHERKLLSPYATITKPRTPSHSSSGHGSDNSSTISTEVHSHPGCKGEKPHGGTSSGYESMLRESEGTASSSDHEDSGSENSDRKKGTKRKGTKRSRSAPARSSESPGSNGGGGSRVWHGHKAKDEPLELKKYDVDDVERMQRRRQEEGEAKSAEPRRLKDSQGKTSEDKGSNPELIDSKDRITLERSGWGFDCKFLMCFCKSRPQGTDV